MQQAMKLLGFRGLVFLGIGILIVAAVIRRRWRKSAANEEEVLRLLSMASEETAMAELEASSAYGFVKKEERPLLQCVVCFCPTTRRCSQCKSVRYCSGKCQIAHWRQGHKNECHYMRSKYAMRSDLQQELDSSNDEEKTQVDSEDANICKDTVGSDTLDISEMLVSDDISSTMESNHVDEKVKSSLRSNRAKIAKSKETPLLSKDMAKSTKFSSSNKDEDRSHELQSKEVHASRAIASDDHQRPSIGEHLGPSSKSAKADDFHSLPAKTSSAFASPEISRNGLKTSVRKVVQQFRVSKLSKCDTPSTGNAIAGKQKLIFPYELFVKLYTDDTMLLGPFGLTNCGNSCYANAVLQCLAFTRPLTSYFLQKLHSKSCRNKDWCFVCEFEYLIHKAREGTSPVSPIRILSKLHKIGSHLGHGKEEDAHEFLRYAVETMQSVFLNNAGASGTMAEESSLAGTTFGGHLLSKIKCMKCLGKSEHRERMMDLTVEIDGEIGSLEQALAQFTATETLDRDNKYHCIRCKSYERARKKLTLLEAPNILTIVLKRFKSGNFEKLSKSVQFPEVLDIAPYMSSRTSGRPPLYSLYAVVVHLDIMNANYSGHYVCYVKSIQGKWFKIDDTSVQPVKIERVLSEGAYMLLYARQNPRPPSMITEPQSGVKLKKRSSEAVGNPKPKPYDTPVVPTLDPYEWVRIRSRGSDSLSESSSIFSSSDASSSSTVSTSTEDFSDYIFGDRPNSLLSPIDLEREEDKPTNRSRHRRKSTSGYESDFRENPFDFRTGLSSRRSSAQTIL